MIIQDGLRRMYAEGEQIFYYLSVYNEVYDMPPMPEGSAEGILKGLYRLSKTPADESPSRRPQLLWQRSDTARSPPRSVNLTGKLRNPL